MSPAAARKPFQKRSETDLKTSYISFLQYGNYNTDLKTCCSDGSNPFPNFQPGNPGAIHIVPLPALSFVVRSSSFTEFRGYQSIKSNQILS